LGSLVAEVLGLERPPGDGDRLADLGFDSLAYAELATVLQQDAGIDLLDAGMAEIATVRDLRAMVDAAAADRGAAGERFPEGLGRAQRRVKRALAGLFRSWFDLSVVGAEHVPETGPAVLCMNHESGLDIPAGVVACPRPITFMAKRELFRRPAQARV